MPIDFDRQTRAGESIPAGPPDAQSIFKPATCLAYSDGLGIAEAVEFGTEQARQDTPGYTPLYDPALLAL